MAKKSEATRKTYKVNYPYGLNLREAPSKNAKILRVLNDGMIVTERDEETPDGWLAVDGGYVMKEYLK